MGRFPSGQRGQTVNLLALPSKVRILLSPNRVEEQIMEPMAEIVIGSRPYTHRDLADV